MTPERVAELKTVYHNGLFNDVLPFWCKHAVDREHGGFMTSLDRDGCVIDTDKSVWQQGRFSWLLGELFNNFESNNQWLELARHGITFIEQHCFDPTDGRMWFNLNRAGDPIRKRRYAFSESFAAIAFGEMAQATGEPRYAELAIKCFDRFIDHNLNPQEPAPKFTETRPMKSIGFHMITIVTAQQLRDSIGLESAGERIDRAIETIERDFVRDDLNCVLENVATDGSFVDHFDGRLLNPGHAIECAWFIMWEGKFRNDSQLIKLGTTMLDRMWERGWDSEHGGILYFVDARGLPVQEYWHDMKFWWPQCETIIATLLAYQLTGDERYAKWHQQIHDWTHQLMPDAEHGEWFGYFHRDGRRSVALKGNMWKGPFHIPRMQLTCLKILDEIAGNGRQAGSR